MATLGQHYADRAQQIYTRMDEGIARMATLFTLLAGLAVLLAAVGVVGAASPGRSPKSPA